MEERVFAVGGLTNARDLGGLPLRDGGQTPYGIFIRAERPDRLNAGGWDRLRARGVRTVLDLRQPDERSAHRVRVPGDFEDRHVDHDGHEYAEFWTNYWDNGLVGTPLYYLPHLQALPGQTGAVLSAIASAPRGGVLFHCTAGWDRTGIIAAVLLMVASVEVDAIVEDYLETVRNAKALAAGLGRPDDEPEVTALLVAAGTTRERAFRGFLAGLDVEAVLGRLPRHQAEALRNWRGGLPPALT